MARHAREQAPVALAQPLLGLAHQHLLDLEEDLRGDPVALVRGQERPEVEVGRRHLGEGEAVVDDRGRERRALVEGGDALGLARAAAVLVDAPVERLQQRVERLLALAQRLAAQLERVQVLGRVEAVRHPEQVQQALAPVGLAHRRHHAHERRLVLREVARRVAGAQRERADLAELALEEALLQQPQPRVDVDQEHLAALVELRRRQVGQRRAEQLLGLGESAGRVARRGRVLEEESGGHGRRYSRFSSSRSSLPGLK